MASSSQSLNDQGNGAKLSRLLVNKGTQALRAKFVSFCHPSKLAAVLNNPRNKSTLEKLKKRKVIMEPQWNLLYPPYAGLPDSQKFDVTLLTLLLRNICGLAKHNKSVWKAFPPDSDTSDVANIVRIQFYRNEVYAHITTTAIADNEFKNLWLKISKALTGLGIPKSELDELKEAPLSAEEAVYIQQLEDWYESDAEINADVKEIKADVKKIKADAKETKADVKETKADVKQIQNSLEQRENVSVIDKLCKCDFSWIKSLNEKFLPGTRQWLFDQLNAWFTDKDSDSTVMILTAGPGVGKSYFAAEVCRMYAEQGRLAACHFCQYNKTDYSNQRMIIESLASNICDNVKGFKAKLDDQLQRSHSKETLSDSFRVHVNDPLYALGEREPMLLVIDALDESEVRGKSQFLELISDEFPKLPQWIKILITSRPELPVKEQLQQHLNLVEIIPGDTKNEEDLRNYLRNYLSHICSDDEVLWSLTKKCEGSFLYAYYTQLELKETTKQLTIENISELVSKGIGGFYKKQFEHLRHRLSKHDPSEVKFKRFRQVLVAAEGPLPLRLLLECLGLPDDIEVRESILEIMSSILPVYDSCLTVYHKSLRDWLVSDGYEEHAFTVDSHSGHAHLWRACKKVFDQIISSAFSSVEPRWKRYALAHGISHMIKCGSKSNYHLSVDVRIVHARITTKTHNTMMLEWREIVNRSPSDLSSEHLLELNWHIKEWEFTVGIDTFYLQSVANRINFSNETRLVARSLLEQGHHFWFENLDATNLTNHFCKSVSLRNDVTCMCVSSDEQRVAAGYKDGLISILKVPDFQEVNHFDTMPESCTQGVSGGWLCSCSFSPSRERLVTCDGSKKVKLWDVQSGNLLARLQAGGPVDYCSFTEDGKHIVANKSINRKDRGETFIYFVIGGHEDEEEKLRKNQDFTVWDVLTLPPKETVLPFVGQVRRYHRRHCLFHHAKEMQLTISIPLDNLHPCLECLCHFESIEPRPVTFQKLYVVPFSNRLSMFSISDRPSIPFPPLRSFAITCCCFSPDGSSLATFLNGLGLIWDTKLCTVIKVLPCSLIARACWWSENLLWIYNNGDLMKIPISNPSDAQLVKIDRKPTKLLTFSDVLVFIDQEKSVNVARIKNGELLYVEKLPVDSPIVCAAVSPCHSIIFMVSSESTFHVWNEDQTSQPHWVASNNGDFPRIMKNSEGDSMPVTFGHSKCCITSDSTKGVFCASYGCIEGTFCGSNGIEQTYGREYHYFILVDLNSKTMNKVRISPTVKYFDDVYAGNSYCIFFNWATKELKAVELASGEVVAEWNSHKSEYGRQGVAHSKNDLLAIFSSSPSFVEFLKIVVKPDINNRR